MCAARFDLPALDENLSEIYHSRLIVGGGNMSFTQAFLDKPRCIECLQHEEHEEHDLNPLFGLASSITATELISREVLERNELTQQRLANLEAEGVTFDFEVDARTIHEKYAGIRFHRIHWNSPHDGSDYKLGTHRSLLKSFFESASQLQEPGDQVHISIVESQSSTWARTWRQICVYGLPTAAIDSDYKLVKQRPFNTTRYPSYEFTHTKDGVTSEKPVLWQYIFEKTTDDATTRTFDYEKLIDDKTRAIWEQSYGIEEGASLRYYRKCRADDSSDIFISLSDSEGSTSC